jgi:integrase/recombinase XerD
MDGSLPRERFQPKDGIQPDLEYWHFSETVRPQTRFYIFDTEERRRHSKLLDPARDYYSREELEKFFAACDPEEKVRYMFFLFTGCREREVTYACWSDFRLAPQSKPGEDPESSIYVVRPKPDLKFCTKTSETRDVPIDDKLVKALKEHHTLHPASRLVFTTKKGKPEGHFLAKLKAIALRAGLNCGQCMSKKGKSCATHPVCNEWTLHKFRRTWATLHLRAGVSTYELQDWIGHSDQAVLKRYAKNACAQSAQTWVRGVGQHH